MTIRHDAALGKLPARPVVLDESSIDVLSELAIAAGKIYSSIAKIDLACDRVCILYSSEKPEDVGHVYAWSDYFRWCVSIMNIQCQVKASLLENFSCDNLLKIKAEGRHTHSQEFAYNRDGLRNWLTIQAFFCDSPEGNPSVYLLIRDSNEDYLLRSIVNQYVYSNCDYFIYLDAKNNSYTMFGGNNSGTPLPPVQCADYSNEIIVYARDHVVPEDRDMVIAEMQLPRVLAVLEHCEVHSFYCGIMDPARGYTRKRLDYRFHDRERQMILLSRTDVTDMYLEEQAHQKSIQEALRRAQTDPLTGLLNYQGTIDKINDSFVHPDSRFALMFIDLDNFKNINDTLGHISGDELLKQIAQILRKNTRETDIVGRIGGDEFVVFLRWIRSLEEVEVCAQRLCDSIRDMDYEVETSCSIGIALAPEDGTDYHTLVKKADRLVYHAKTAGKGRYSI